MYIIVIHFDMACVVTLLTNVSHRDSKKDTWTFRGHDQLKKIIDFMDNSKLSTCDCKNQRYYMSLTELFQKHANKHNLLRPQYTSTTFAGCSIRFPVVLNRAVFENCSLQRSMRKPQRRSFTNDGGDRKIKRIQGSINALVQI